MSQVSFRKIERSDLELVRQWRNSTRVNSQMINQQYISKDAQNDWFNRVKQSNDQKHFICLLDGRAIGVLNFSGITKLECEWGCYLGEERVLPGIGLVIEAAALIYSFNYLSVNRLNANVLASNTNPQSMHRFYGYNQLENKIVTNASGMQLEMACFYYQKEQWELNFKAVYDKLPKLILKVIENTEFIVD